ncbi:T7SS effector LXG polymorphic toxin [Bacillus marasmi]|uniref:T7SS effector LXG polymorphic toxin n=1 Tax=Bacillus marasmi TaxID=1926279 RepID=UPI0011CCC622|nr:T7SS effector LXG polymorphic toxin [Bacillus marasmi]
MVHVPFLEETLKKAAQKSNEIVSEKKSELNRIFRNIDDIIFLDVFSSAEFDYQMYLAEKERKDTLEKVHELDYDLLNRYQKSQPAETYAKLLFQQLLESSKKNGAISPIHFNTKAYHNSEIYRTKKAELEKGSKAKKEPSSSWYKMVGDISLGIVEGAWKAVVDIFKGLIDLAISLVTDPVNFFKGIMNAVTHPINTAKYMWNGIETAWKRDVVNGNARSRSEFFSYAAVSIIGLKGFDKVGKLGKLDKVSKAKPTLPYNVLNTEKLKGFIYNKVKTNFSNEKEKIVQFLKNKPVQITLNQAVRAVQNAKTLSNIKNVLNPIKLKKGFENTYRDIIRSPLAKTKSAIDWSIDRRIKKIGEVKVPTSFKVNQVEISGGFNFINVSTESAPLKNIFQKFRVEQENKDNNFIGTKGTGKETYQHLKDYKNNKYFTRSVEYNASKDGTGFTYKVYQRGDINWDMVRTKGAKKGRGLTNAEASAKYGLAPILDDAGSVATLHHSQQKGVGPLYEASTRYHNISNAKRPPLHPYKGKLNPFYPMEETTRGAFQKVDSINYWKIRGEEVLGGK